jgi:methylisocitrate lyase
MDQFCKTIKEVALVSGLPILADADTGFGEGEMVHKTVYEYFLSGASGLHIEDQVFPKRCGHLDGKALISREDMATKVSIAARASREVSGGEFVICARTDAAGVIGLDETIARSKLFIEAGADMIFPEGLNSEDDFARVAKELKGYGKKGGPFLLANMTEFGKTPYITLEKFKQMGYHCVIYPVSTFRIANKAIDSFLKDLKQKGTQKDTVPNMQTRKELYNTIKYTPGKEYYYPDATNQNK